MKLSSSTLCGCCFCCYCHCWLMMLLMVSSVVHVSPEMSTTLTSTTTTTKKYTKLYNNNNYAYQSEMTEEFIQLNRKISNRTKSREVVATATTTSSSPTFPSTAMLPLLPQIHEPVATTTTTGDYHYKPNNEQSFIKFEHETITTIATIQTQQLTISTSHLHATATTTPAIPLATTTTMISTLTLAPEQIQMNKKQQNPYKKVETKHSENVEREEEEESNVYTFDNSIEEEEEAEVTTSRTITTTTNYAADNSHVFVPPTILSIESTTEHFVKPMKKILSNNKNNNSSNNNNNNVKSTKYWNISIDLQPNKTRNQQQENNTSNSKSKSSDNNNSNTSSSSNSDNSLNNHNEGSKDFVNSNYRSSNSKQKTTTNTFSLNHNNRYGTVNKNNNNNNSSTNTSTSTSINFVTQNHVATKIENGTATTTTTRVLNATAINSLPSSGTFDFHNKTSKTHNFKNHNNKNSKSNNNSSNNYYDSIATSTDSDSNLSPKEMNQYTDITKTHHHNQHRPQLQMPTTSLSAATATTTALRIPTTYTPLHEYHGHSQMKRPVLLHRHARQAAGAAATDDEQNDKCRMFVEGDPEKNELYSPDYPNDYPKNINCTRVIIAPKGQIIRLDFRNSFHIEEKEECKFDFLEIRDGQYGFSNLIGKFCGTDFPPEITSKERYLWLHFHSDESIEYSGFTAVYEFIDRNRDAPSTDLNCTIERDGFEGFVNASDVPTEIKETVIRNKIPLDCMWRIQVQEKWKIQVKFVDFKLAKPNDCESNFLDIFPEQTVMPLRVKNFCGSAGEGITSESNILHVRFYAEQSAITSSFSILYTAFRERGSSSCAEDEYDCEDATCIAGNLKCNGRSNCKFLWDEEGCKPEDNGQSEHMIIIITVFGLILGGMVITFLVNCVRKIMHDQKIIREHIRQSKESKLDEMGRNSKGRSRDNISIVSPRQKHSQTSLQILDDVSNRYYREIEMQTKSNFKEKDPSILRHDMIVQTSLCSTDDSSTTTTTEHQQQQQQQQTQPTGVGSNACDMGCQTRESLFATASLMRQKSKTPSLVGSQRTIEGVPPPPRFSTFGYDAAQIAPPPPPTVSTLSRRNMHLPQETLEMEQLPQQTTHTMMMMMPHQQHHQHPQQQQHPQHQQHQHLHHRPSQEICHHHHQHQQHLQQQQQKQTLPRHHQQQQQQQQQLPQHHQHMQQQQQQQHHQYHTSSTTIPPNVTQTPAQPPGTAVVTAISTGSSGRQREQQGTGGSTAGKNKQTKVDESKVFIDIRNSAPDVIIMTSH
ncbi:neuropilin and tolloid-like isoform 1-T4 [Cochliomyia hominivorax]